ncbi:MULTISPECIES: ComEC/Rec2 family competence protein [Phyllobacteriaceae]|jgi:ComEC/Rec2-related protein|uniref:Competence protein n=3 Tax=Pseudomonadota TaxID=1224 RepID=A0A1C2DT24_9HYPH|nr:MULTISPECIES: ComEC/Rec2 family competence protein [Mesorhizobium]MBN9236250.1 ComEC/Rec2 family competence protein [Mesorhizobium sp.]MDQ0327850.1 competence protein ComEC [Mesorhizobium sp. YL-MeA3-2017]OCX17766.1 competence protein [Mesorhizobium hungaricum]
MAGRGRSGQGGADADRGISEQLLFASTQPLFPPAARLPDGANEAGGPVAESRVIPVLPPEIARLQPPPVLPDRIAVWTRRMRLLLRQDWRGALGSVVSLELDRGAAFLFAPVFLAAGAAVYFSLTEEPAFLQPVASCLALAAIALLAGAKAHLAAMAVLFFVLGILAGKVETWRMPGDTLGAEVSTGITGRVVAVEPMASGRTRLTLDVLSTQRPKLRYQPERVRLSALAVPDGVKAGSEVNGYARLMPPAGPVRPNGYDFSFESFFDGIGATGFFMGKPKLVTPANDAMPVMARLSVAVETARETIAARIRATIGGAEGEIAAALIVGVRAGIPEPVNEAMRRTGIYHIISISGLHMALVAGTVMALLRGTFALFPDFSARHPVKKYAALAALVSIAAYLAISGMVVAAERSFIMLAVMLVAVLLDRAALSMRNLAISAVVVILIAPHEVVGPSFQMSFAATAALIGAYAAWSERRGIAPTGPPPARSLAGFLVHKSLVGLIGLAVTSIVAGLATALFAAWHFQRISPLSLLANLAVMPIVSLVVMPAAVFSALAMPFGADGPFLYAMGKGLSAMMAIAEWISARSPVDAVGLVSTQSVLLVTAALAIGAMATTWLRLLAVPLAFAGIVAMDDVETPDVLVAEDARLVAMPIGGGELAVSRPRPNAFTLDNWRRALDAETVVLPETAASAGVALADAQDLPPGTPFLCAQDLCFARHPDGPVVATAPNARAAKPACAVAAVIVIDDATARDLCEDAAVVVITRQDLARAGSAAVYFDPQNAAAAATARFALEDSSRPWHAQRRFSREARGLPPRQQERVKSNAKAGKFDASANRFDADTNRRDARANKRDATPNGPDVTTEQRDHAPQTPEN